MRERVLTRTSSQSGPSWPGWQALVHEANRSSWQTECPWTNFGHKLRRNLIYKRRTSNEGSGHRRRGGFWREWETVRASSQKPPLAQGDSCSSRCQDQNHARESTWWLFEISYAEKWLLLSGLCSRDFGGPFHQKLIYSTIDEPLDMMRTASQLLDGLQSRTGCTRHPTVPAM